MTGMKEGVGENPFDRDDLVDEEPDEVDEQPTTSSTSSEVSRPEPVGRTSKRDIPYIYRRDRVTDERDQMPFYLREETLDVLEERLLEFEDQLGEDVSKIDFRELALLVGVEHLDEMSERAREWGYDID